MPFPPFNKCMCAWMLGICTAHSNYKKMIDLAVNFINKALFTTIMDSGKCTVVIMPSQNVLS